MAKSVSSIYDNIENLVPFYPEVVYSQSKDTRPKEGIEIELDKMGEDAMFLKRILDVSYEQVLRWFRGVATKPERNECEGAMGKQLSNCEEEERNRLMAICRRYSLSVAGEATCSQETPSPSPKEKSDITAMKQVRTTKAEGEGQKVTHVTQEVQVEVPNAAVRVSLNKKEKEEYWEAYYSFWDDFVREWYNQRRDGYKVPQDEISKEYDNISKEYDNAVANLVFDELPNPYFGDPKNGVDAVIINLNPGGSEKDANKAGTDATQFYSNLKYGEHGKGWLMWKFVHEAGCSYRGFIGNDKNLLKDGKVVNWSQLNPELRGHEPEVCGVKWWQGTRNGTEMWEGRKREIINSDSKRIEWIRRIYKGGDWISPSRVFALELCPYHSKKFNAGFRQEIVEFIKNWVVMPAVRAATENELDFALAIGGMNRYGSGTMTDTLRKICGEPEKVWGYDEPVCGWPTTGKGTPTHRKYVLYAVRNENEKSGRILATISEGGITAPSPDFKQVEMEIRKYIKNHPL